VEAIESNDATDAFSHLENASTRLEDAAEPLADYEFEESDARLASLQDRHERLTQQATRLQLETDLDNLEARIKEACDLAADDEYEAALAEFEAAMEEVNALAKRVKAHDEDKLQNRLESLRKRCKEGIEQMETAQASFPVPDTIPGAPRLSLVYDDIEKGELLGRGGNADVYHATVNSAEGTTDITVKEPRMGGTLHTETVDRMLEEANTWQQLADHDHIVSVVDYGSEPLPWIAMEYMDAGHLGDQREEMDIQQKLWTVLAVTEGVYHAHRRGVAHRDLKPENILFRAVDEAWNVPKVADWGLSKHLLEQSKSRDGMTVEYAAPEQFSNDQSTDTRTDVYQLGAVFYELFTDQPPFEGEMFAVMEQIKQREPAPPSEITNVPTALDDILLTAMAKEPGERYDDILYMRDDIQAVFEEL